MSKDQAVQEVQGFTRMAVQAVQAVQALAVQAELMALVTVAAKKAATVELVIKALFVFYGAQAERILTTQQTYKLARKEQGCLAIKVINMFFIT